MTETFDAVLAEMREYMAGNLHKLPTDPDDYIGDWIGRLAAAHAAEVESLRETNRRMNRRVQMAEAALPSYRKLIAIPPDGDGVRLVNGNFGRALLTWSCEQLAERAEAAERDAGELRDLLRECLPYIDSTAKAMHILDGFRPGPANEHDELVVRITNAIATTEQADG